MYNQKLIEVQKLEAQEELVKLRNEIKRLDIRLNLNKVQQIPDYYDRDLQNKAKIILIIMKTAKMILTIILTIHLEHKD